MSEAPVLDVLDGEADEDIPELPPLPQRVVRKAGHRQPRAIADDGRTSFWLSAPRDGFTRIGEQETAKTAHTRAGSSVGFRLLQE